MSELIFAVSINPRRMGGAPCVAGTRIPVDFIAAMSVERDGDEPNLETLLRYYPQLEGKVTAVA